MSLKKLLFVLILAIGLSCLPLIVISRNSEDSIYFIIQVEEKGGNLMNECYSVRIGGEIEEGIPSEVISKCLRENSIYFLQPFYLIGLREGDKGLFFPQKERMLVVIPVAGRKEIFLEGEIILKKATKFPLGVGEDSVFLTEKSCVAENKNGEIVFFEGEKIRKTKVLILKEREENNEKKRIPNMFDLRYAFATRD